MKRGAPNSEVRIAGPAGILVGCLLAALGWNLPADDTKTDFEVDGFRWQEAVGDPVQIIVSNPYGNVRSRSWPQTEVSVTGQIQHYPDEAPLIVEVEEQRQTIRVTVRAPEGESEVTDKLARADLVVLAPPGISMSVYTTDGDIKFKKYYGNVTARSERGDISLRTTGAIEAVSRSGAINARLNKRWDGPISLKTDSGLISIRIPEAVNAVIKARSERGSVYTDLPEAILHDANRKDNAFSARLGTGGRDLFAESGTGDIRVVIADEGIRE